MYRDHHFVFHDYSWLSQFPFLDLTSPFYYSLNLSSIQPSNSILIYQYTSNLTMWSLTFNCKLSSIDFCLLSISFYFSFSGSNSLSDSKLSLSILKNINISLCGTSFLHTLVLFFIITWCQLVCLFYLLLNLLLMGKWIL